jgi:hypothetical protein
MQALEALRAKIGPNYETAICFVVFVAILEVYFPESALFVSPLILLSLLFPGRTMLLLAAGNVIMRIVGPALTSQQTVHLRMLETLYFAEATVCTFAFFYIFAQISISWSRAWAISILLFLVCAITAYISHALLSSFFWRAVLIELAQGALFNAYYLRVRSKREEIRLVNFLANQHTYYYRAVIPVPALLGDRIEQRKKLNSADLLSVRWQGVMILMIGLMAKVALMVLRPHVAQWFNLEPMSPTEAYHPLAIALSLGQFMQQGVSTSTRWMLTLLAYASQVGRVFEVGMLGIAVCRMFGIQAKSPVYDLFGARSMSQFFERTNHYYAQMLLDIFVYPVLRLFRVATNPRALTVSVALGIFLGGIVSHHLAITVLVGVESSFYPNDLWGPVVYWAIMSALVTGSLYFERRHLRRLISTAERGLRWCLYFVASAITFLFILQYYSNSVSFTERLHLFGSLFGF